ncbi:MAG: hypothetical protein HQ564_02735 [Candidatus Saganbacteria bacterium]|nr:hypothetical protein [Candidatus Saganbacteria bacterium]
MMHKFKIISFDSAELLEGRELPKPEEILTKLEKNDPDVYNSLRQMGIPIAKVLLPHLNKKGHLAAIVSRFIGGFYSDEEISQYLQVFGETKEQLCNKLIKIDNSVLFIMTQNRPSEDAFFRDKAFKENLLVQAILKRPEKQLTQDEITKSVLRYPGLVASYFPMVCNLVQGVFSVSELISLALSVTKGMRSYGMGELLKWIPLLEPHFSKKELEDLIIRLIGFSSDFVAIKYAREWIDYVAEETAPTLINSIVNNSDFKMRDEFFLLLHLVNTPKINKVSEHIKKLGGYSLFTGFPDYELLSGTPSVSDKIIIVNHHFPIEKSDAQQNVNMEIIERGNWMRAIVKIDGIPTFLAGTGSSRYLVALRTVKSPDGSFSIMEKGLYAASKRLSERLSDLFRQLPENDISPEIDISDKIEITPVGFWDILLDSARFDSKSRSNSMALSDMSYSDFLTTPASSINREKARERRQAFLRLFENP